MPRLGLPKIACIVVLFCLATAIASRAQTFSTVYRFAPSGGYGPNTPLVQGLNGSLYGTMSLGGAVTNKTICSAYDQFKCGTAFEITPGGQYKVIYDFCVQANCADGGRPGSLILGSNGNLYGTTNAGGANNGGSSGICNDQGCGTAFEITPAGKLTTLYNFCNQVQCSDGVYAFSLLQGDSGNLYGVTSVGGIPNQIAGCWDGCGTMFELTPTGKFSTFADFCTKLTGSGGCANGWYPVSLIQATNGNFYGATYYGGTGQPNDCVFGCGTLFEISPNGKLTSLYSFCSQANCVDGQYPNAIIQGIDGNLYGTTQSGGVYGGGTVFQVSRTGQFTTIYNFCNWGFGYCPDGSAPTAGLLQGTDGNFYSSALGGDPNEANICLGSGCGIIFQLTPAGQVTNLYTFCTQTNCPDGGDPGALMQATNGTFYGTTSKGAHAGCVAGGGCGTTFSLSVGLDPFVEANPDFGTIGHVVNILGNNLTGTTSVTFNGTSAAFKIVSDTYLKAKVPAGATTGTIEVTTPTGTLHSSLPFQVLP